MSIALFTVFLIVVLTQSGKHLPMAFHYTVIIGNMLLQSTACGNHKGQKALWGICICI